MFVKSEANTLSSSLLANAFHLTSSLAKTLSDVWHTQGQLRSYTESRLHVPVQSTAIAAL